MKSKYFSYNELKCKCGCDKCLIQEDFLAKLDDLRESMDMPLVITSGYRCPDHNEKVSFSGRNGSHTTGRAVDIGVNRKDAYLLLQFAFLKKFTGIGVHQSGAGRFIHLDDLTNLDKGIRPTVWSY